MGEDVIVSISANQFITVLLGAAISWGVMMTTVLGLKHDLREHRDEEQKILDDHEHRIRSVERRSNEK